MGVFKHRKAVSFYSRSVFVLIITCGTESWVITERIISQGQAAEMGFLQRVHCVTLGDKVRSCEILRALNVEKLLRIERSQICWFGHVSSMTHERLARHVQLAKPMGKRPEVIQGLGGVTTSPTLLGLFLVLSQQNYLKSLLTVRYCKSSDCCPRLPWTAAPRKAVH